MGTRAPATNSRSLTVGPCGSINFFLGGSFSGNGSGTASERDSLLPEFSKYVM